GVPLTKHPTNNYDAVIVAVNHAEYKSLEEEDFRAMLNDDKGVFVDVKGIFKDRIKNIEYWSL
ncbi:hypothetical protein N8010_03725, partial [Crocinitomicaceae bacterium]|nr:hypothetical protein [Crocinitomicaceae bacterium]